MFNCLLPLLITHHQRRLILLGLLITNNSSNQVHIRKPKLTLFQISHMSMMKHIKYSLRIKPNRVLRLTPNLPAFHRRRHLSLPPPLFDGLHFVNSYKLTVTITATPFSVDFYLDDFYSLCICILRYNLSLLGSIHSIFLNTQTFYNYILFDV